MGYLPVTQAVRDRVNATLASFAARGFTPPPMRDLVRNAELDEKEEKR